MSSSVLELQSKFFPIIPRGCKKYVYFTNYRSSYIYNLCILTRICWHDLPHSYFKLLFLLHNYITNLTFNNYRRWTHEYQCNGNISCKFWGRIWRRLWREGQTGHDPSTTERLIQHNIPSTPTQVASGMSS